MTEHGRHLRLVHTWRGRSAFLPRRPSSDLEALPTDLWGVGGVMLLSSGLGSRSEHVCHWVVPCQGCTFPLGCLLHRDGWVGGLPRCPGAVFSVGCVHCRFVLGVTALVALQWCLDEQFSALALSSPLMPAIHIHSFLSMLVGCCVPATQNRMC